MMIDDDTISLMWDIAFHRGMRAAIEEVGLVPREVLKESMRQSDKWAGKYGEALNRAERAVAERDQLRAWYEEAEKMAAKERERAEYAEVECENLRGILETRKSEIKELRESLLQLDQKFRSIRYQAYMGHQDRPPWERLNIIGQIADSALTVASEGRGQGKRERLVGCEGKDGLLRTHRESETCDVCGAMNTKET